MTSAFAHFLAHLTTVSARFEKRADRGATAVEYGLLVGLIAVVIIVGVTMLGTELLALFNDVASKI
nr:Flp family type IVb pilin [uncultured Friedmanniella sp.]